MSERVDGETAFILHTRPWRETSLVVDVFSRHHGRLGLVARGARRPSASLKARLVPFQPLSLAWFGKGGLRTLHAAEWHGGEPCPRGHGLMCGFYLNELLLRLLPEGDPHEALFDHYRTALAGLSGAADVEPVLRRFELVLLSELGYAQPLGHMADGSGIQASARYGYAYGVGVVPVQPGAPTYLGRVLLDLARGDLGDAVTLAEGKLLLRGLLTHYLGEKPLATRQLLIDLQRL
ncbi:MAG TPA: DNA repair protein RecO [Thiobacillaceae bacterium]|nr:DNA repair protein RecO [Thiobacillaceae bacterium]HNU64242.1 DNA repair protein RecO [Thiobacillaceae bacterium]